MKANKRSLFILLIFFFNANLLFAQQLSLKGKVVSETGMPVAGATVVVKSGKQATTTNLNGEFNLVRIAPNATLIVTCIGYNMQEAIVKGNDSMVIKLSLHNSQLDEVIIQAYGTTTQRKNTGNITKITAAEIANQPVSNPLAALEGRVPGVNITQSSGVPGSSFNVEVRGRSTLDGSLSRNDPLIVIDGVFFEAGNQSYNQLRSAANDNFGHGGLSPLNNINPNDIESIEVLKDADATAIYGSRGANGVLLITTKKGKAGKTVFNGNVYSGISTVPGTMNLLNTRQYVQMRKEGFKNDGITPSADPADPGFAPDIMLWDTTRYTDLKKLLIGNTARSTDVQGTLTGGNPLNQFLIGGGYHRETNVFSDDLADTRATLHFSLNHSSENRKFTMGFSGGYSNDKNQLIATDLTQYINLPPNLLLRDKSGNLAFQEAGVSYATVNNMINPLAILQQTNTAITENLYSNLQLSYKILPSLLFKVSAGYNTFKTDEVSIIPQSSIDPYVASYTPASSAFSNTSLSSWIIEPQLSYTKSISKGSLNVLIGGTFQEKKMKSNVIQATNFSSDLLLNNPAAAGLVTADIEQSLYHYEAVFGRVNYDWQGKYILNATFRRDGSSRFGPNKQFANFGAFGAGWIFSDEPIIQRHLPFLSFGKLRASYGITGNDQIGDYNYLSLYQNTGITYNGSPTLSPAKLYNPDYRWQTNKKAEIGIELGWLRDRLFFTASYYRERSSNQLVNYPLPTQTGFQNVVMNLPALVQNSGIELVLNTKNVNQKNFKWTTSLNATIPRNKLLSFPGLASTSYRSIYVVGQPLSVIYGFKYLGVNPQTGVYNFQDVNNDGKLNASDYQPLGNLNPKYYGGVSNTITVRQFQLDFLFEFKKQMGRNYLAQLFNNFPGIVANQPTIVLNRWQQPGDISTVQQYTAGNNQAAIIAANTQLNISNGIYGDASYIRLKNVALAYHLPESFLKHLGITGGKVYINAQNVLTITKYKGLDPETQNFYVLPPLRTIAAGLQLSF
ncbi:SusC/RagA family TonB-linked outer membrane protein [Mucilaginibacter sp. SP1R1]|uniref:SusC/RagA family TonB-linked outer membrane protein n=1 Tax=Mucilaginibacter sp. SP1R1 TaxID=2723091 RepID=UPI001617F532|nr:SusC/RagA family TonB-linked outer membrane protein [Mucilaginibacter sp. SP1R1]MBB6150495.1 TonB-linked SusC/RagA family outer membrane protein [Mucilaginibacter sp. SP1R1]